MICWCMCVTLHGKSCQSYRSVSPSFQDFGKQTAESARYQEQVTDTPQYRPYTNPDLQSQSFKTLQTVVDSGRGNFCLYDFLYSCLNCPFLYCKHYIIWVMQ